MPAGRRCSVSWPNSARPPARPSANCCSPGEPTSSDRCYFVLGFERLLRAGIGIAALVLILLGRPLSGLASAPEMLPHPWGALGQLLPPGATGTLPRNVSFFDGAAITQPIVVLVVWAVLGLAAYYLAGRRHRARQPFDIRLDPATLATG
ncbi:MAG TPA: hypothetical protein VK659_11025 [Asanoa sp.]|nr:hypothetical protein [Asanoa sp.]